MTPMECAGRHGTIKWINKLSSFNARPAAVWPRWLLWSADQFLMTRRRMNLHDSWVDNWEQRAYFQSNVLSALLVYARLILEIGMAPMELSLQNFTSFVVRSKTALWMAGMAHNRFGEWPQRLPIASYNMHRPSMGWAYNKNKWTLTGIAEFCNSIYRFKIVFNHLINQSSFKGAKL